MYLARNKASFSGPVGDCTAQKSQPLAVPPLTAAAALDGLEYRLPDTSILPSAVTRAVAGQAPLVDTRVAPALTQPACTTRSRLIPYHDFDWAVIGLSSGGLGS